MEKTALAHFPGIDKDEALKGPILFSNWLSKDYMPVEQEQLRDYVKARLKVRKQFNCGKILQTSEK